MSASQQPERAQEHAVPAYSRLLSIRQAVMERWEREVFTRVEGAKALRELAPTQALPALFDDIAMALATNGPLRNKQSPHRADSPAAHGADRARNSSFGPAQVVHEYHIFRESISFVAEGLVEIDAGQWRRIDQSIDDATREALEAFTAVHEAARLRVAAALSHDMRTPLAVIASGAQLISIVPTMEKARIAASKIESNALRLKEMLGDVLDALTFRGGVKIAFHMTQFDALELVKEVRSQYVQGGASEIDFQAEGTSAVGWWSRDTLRRALENLVNNAVKYGAGHAIAISARANRDRLVLSVRNQGEPIPDEQRERIFDYLHRDKNVSSVPGWGIGLPFVKAVAEGHGGEVSVDSARDRGTTFFMHLPMDSRMSPAEKPAPVSA